MQIAHRATARQEGAAPHRGGGIHFTYLLDGDPAMKDNFSLSIIDFEDGYSTPRHRHNFEQIRVMLDGEFSFAPGKTQKPGSVGYFCEGGYYTQHGLGRSRMLLLQVAGPGGEPYLNHDLLREGGRQLAEVGAFDDGVYSWTDDTGRKHNQDGYEAVWQHVFDRPLSYCKPRYSEPLIMDPDAFGWIEDADADGVEHRTLGVFNERVTRLGMIRLAAGARWTIDDPAQGWLWYVIEGAGHANDEAWSAESALHVDLGERAVIEASSDTVAYTFGLPRFEERRHSSQ